MSSSFGERLRTAVDESGRLCVGIDPHPYLLKDWGLPDSAEGAREFSLRVLAATDGAAAVVKPQVAFFERHGSAGYAALEEVLATARRLGLLVIADAKRGDVGTSVEAYGQAWLTPGSPLEADALTVSAFQGVGSLASVFALANSEGKGLFVLAATSNPESRVLQQSMTAEGRSVAATIADDVVRWNSVATPDAPWGSVGLVLGATVALRDYAIDTADLEGTPVLAPGFGHQGAQLSELRPIFGVAAPSVLVNASRSILSAGPDGVARAIREHAEEIAAAL
nr:orotidine-5'-phosphate decarboxylase [Salinibacterium sp.]